MNSKKSQSLSMNTIIIAALALLVLAIVSLVFISRMNIARTDLNTCQNNGGVCLNRANFGGDCWNDIIRSDPRFMANNDGTELRYACYDRTGNVELNDMCCRFS